MTALGYVWRHENADFEGLEMHIDTFSSKHTKAWDIVRNKAPVSVFYRGDECNPFISCADIIASHVDDAISSNRAKLNDTEVRRVLNPYSFDTTVFFFDKNSIPYCTWKMDQMINPSKYLKRPMVSVAKCGPKLDMALISELSKLGCPVAWVLGTPDTTFLRSCTLQPTISSQRDSAANRAQKSGSLASTFACAIPKSASASMDLAISFRFLKLIVRKNVDMCTR